MKLILCLLCCGFALGASAAMAPAPAPMAVTEAEKLKDMSASDFVYAPALMAPPNMSASTSSKRQLGDWPALEGMGVSQTVFTLGACALRPPHTHLRATGLLYVISGTIQVGFTTEDGKPFVNTVTAGGSTIFPQGLVHYQINLGCEPAMYTISYNHEEPGTQVAVPGLFGLPGNVVAAALGLASNPQESAGLVAGMPTGNFVAASDPTCMQTCAAAMAMAPMASQSTTAGR